MSPYQEDDSLMIECVNMSRTWVRVWKTFRWQHLSLSDRIKVVLIVLLVIFRRSQGHYITQPNKDTDVLSFERINQWWSTFPHSNFFLPSHLLFPHPTCTCCRKDAVNTTSWAPWQLSLTLHTSTISPSRNLEGSHKERKKNNKKIDAMVFLFLEEKIQCAIHLIHFRVFGSMHSWDCCALNGLDFSKDHL